MGADPQRVTGTSRAGGIDPNPQRTLLDNSPHAVLLVRPDWSIAYANGRAAELATNSDLVDATLWSAVPLFANPQAEAELVHSMEQRKEVEFEQQISKDK